MNISDVFIPDMLLTYIVNNAQGDSINIVLSFYFVEVIPALALWPVGLLVSLTYGTNSVITLRAT